MTGTQSTSAGGSNSSRTGYSAPTTYNVASSAGINPLGPRSSAASGRRSASSQGTSVTPTYSAEYAASRQSLLDDYEASRAAYNTQSRPSSGWAEGNSGLSSHPYAGQPQPEMAASNASSGWAGAKSTLSSHPFAAPYSVATSRQAGTTWNYSVLHPHAAVPHPFASPYSVATSGASGISGSFGNDANNHQTYFNPNEGQMLQQRPEIAQSTTTAASSSASYRQTGTSTWHPTLISENILQLPPRTSQSPSTSEQSAPDFYRNMPEFSTPEFALHAVAPDAAVADNRSERSESQASVTSYRSKASFSDFMGGGSRKYKPREPLPTDQKYDGQQTYDFDGNPLPKSPFLNEGKIIRNAGMAASESTGQTAYITLHERRDKKRAESADHGGSELSEEVRYKTQENTRFAPIPENTLTTTANPDSLNNASVLPLVEPDMPESKMMQGMESGTLASMYDDAFLDADEDAQPAFEGGRINPIVDVFNPQQNQNPASQSGIEPFEAQYVSADAQGRNFLPVDTSQYQLVSVANPDPSQPSLTNISMGHTSNSAAPSAIDPSERYVLTTFDPDTNSPQNLVHVKVGNHQTVDSSDPALANIDMDDFHIINDNPQPAGETQNVGLLPETVDLSRHHLFVVPRQGLRPLPSRDAKPARSILKKG